MVLSSWALLASLSLMTAVNADSPSMVALEDTATPKVVEALWDGTCFYPKPDILNFNLTAYLGRWYQVAGTFAPFTAGCSCIYANYSLNSDGDVNVFNSCQRGQRASNITGTASPAGSEYGQSGAFIVKFPFGSTSDCPGPNYIVQDYSYDGQWAIVQASNFSTLFLLSRRQNPSESLIEVCSYNCGRFSDTDCTHRLGFNVQKEEART